MWANGTIPNKIYTHIYFLVGQPSLTNDHVCCGFFSHSQRPNRSAVRKAPFHGRKACDQFWGLLAWHGGMLHRIPLAAFTTHFLWKWIFMWLVSQRKWCFLREELQGIRIKVLSWDSSNLLSSYPRHSYTASKTLGLYILMSSGCYSTLGVFFVFFFKVFFFIGYLILLRISFR